MPLSFDATNQNGQSRSVTVEGLAKALEAKGEEIAGISPDGMSIQVMDAGQPITVPVQEAFQKLGFQVGNPKPMDADYSGVSPKARAAITAISGEDNKLAYLKMLEQRNGNLNPQIIGGGRDFYVFDQKTGRYRALTNNPDWDVSDLAEAGAEAPGAIGAVVGGGLGAASGAATAGATSLPGLMAGAAAGSALGNSFTKIALGIQDQDARKVMMDSAPRQIAGVAGTAALDAATAGIGAKIPGLVSGAAKVGGEITSNVGRLMGHGAKLIDNPIGRDIAGSMVTGPTLATAELATRAPAEGLKAMSRLPGWAGEQLAKAPGWLERKGLLSDLSPETQEAAKNWMMRKAGDLQGFTKRIVNKTDLPSNTRGELFKGAEGFADWAGGRKPSSTVTLEDELANLGEYVGGGKQGRDIYQVAEEGGYSPNNARIYARNPTGQDWGRVGAKAGRALETLNSVGKGIGAVNQMVGGGVVKGLRGAGVGINAAGDAARYAGTVMSPLENRFATRYGSEEYFRKRRPWQMVPNTSTINPVQFASEE